MGLASQKIKKDLLKLAKDSLPNYAKLQITFKSSKRMSDLFKFKDKVPLECRSFLVYNYTCDKCNLAYIGKTFRHFKVRVFEHLGLSLRTGKKYSYNPKNSNNTAVLNHINCCKPDSSFKNFKIIGSAQNDYHLRLKESLLIKLNNPLLNKSVQSTPLLLF